MDKNLVAEGPADRSLDGVTIVRDVEDVFRALAALLAAPDVDHR